MYVTNTAAFVPLLHPRDAAAYLGIHEKTVIRMARNLDLPAIRLGKHWRFRVEDLTAWVAGQVQSTVPARSE
jgi:excisionase family DNA binding protein